MHKERYLRMQLRKKERLCTETHLIYVLQAALPHKRMHHFIWVSQAAPRSKNKRRVHNHLSLIMLGLTPLQVSVRTIGAWSTSSSWNLSPRGDTTLALLGTI